ncbi:MAG: DUF1722 domain-containing protein [Candidatus Bipolaricaulota bacterium]|nr:DUF1722 domain-containing protein [Candidatus Bipolaricaulota bacterium]
MRIWDIHPGYLNRTSLLGEHRELHALVSICIHQKRGYAHHPETLRWRDFLQSLAVRHEILVAEMELRSYKHHSPVEIVPDHTSWPTRYVDPPARQFELLREKYRTKESGRIPLPRSVQQLWAQHKYSVLARDPKIYRELRRQVADSRPEDFAQLSQELVELLRTPPTNEGLRNAIEHMWGYVSDYAPPAQRRQATQNIATTLAFIQQLAYAHRVTYLLHSTALSELTIWLKHSSGGALRYVENLQTQKRTDRPRRSR